MAGDLWTAADVARLRQELQSREPDWHEVARAIGRSAGACRGKARRLGLVKPADEGYGTVELMRLLGCTAQDLGTWAKRRWIARHTVGVRFVYSRHAVRAFLRAHPDVIDAARVDMAWLVETLAGSERRAG